MAFEGLARLVDAGGVNVRPDVFIGVAEEIGLIRRVGLVILDLACGLLATWRNDTPGHGRHYNGGERLRPAGRAQHARQ